MKASVKYNDFIGTSAADISDHTNLDKFLASRGVDTDRYEAIGASFRADYEHYFYPGIICIDKEKSANGKTHIVKIEFEAEFSKDEFLSLFKRLSVVISRNYKGYQENEIDELVTIDDRIEQDDDEEI